MSPAESERPAIAAVLELFDDDRDAMDALLRAAISVLAESVAEIDRGNRAEDERAVAVSAHRLKGASAGIGGARVAAISAAIERTARDGHLVTPAVLKECRNAAAALDADLRSFLKGAPSHG